MGYNAKINPHNAKTVGSKKRQSPAQLSNVSYPRRATTYPLQEEEHYWLQEEEHYWSLTSKTNPNNISAKQAKMDLGNLQNQAGKEPAKVAQG